ncbi:bifunctional 5,10-methylenetetrahydrofolate dehydrogenase/5,10-methenyltetrahydrofolate cyclohydrolase [Actinomadura flavalba]|uniref:bifunctional 5,10-methylenetetrahydrofolate dehydrogenase/5,10-methenyltetrahydrofolate cyclohydrolase n=1 Tax=Actinomadura flavalba TaxID=1120938 RepID=UPI00036E92FA|nr:tetrahydrofolate dehydrogenase/cyclohydrolase catalytic domain-containing protein [Actinomadura flavalba]
MTARLLDGEAAAAAVRESLVERIGALRERGVVPGLMTILVGDDEPSKKYIAMKHRDCAAVGIDSYDLHLPGRPSQDEVDDTVRRANDDPRVHACLIQYPFPRGLDYEAAILRLNPEKDADGLHPVNLGKLVMGADAPRACTPLGIQRLLAHHGIPVAGRNVVIVGRGLTIGRPLADLLTLKEDGANAAVTVVHTGVPDLARHTRRADVLVVAAGSAGLVTADMVAAGAVVVSAGVSFENGRLVPDVTDDVADVAAWITPRIGGVGPMTRIMLLSNTVTAAENTA